MGHNRDGSFDDGLNMRTHILSAFQFDCCGLCLFHDPSGIDHRIVYRRLVGHKRHIHYNKRILCSLHNCSAVVDHILHSHRNRRVIT